MIGVDEFLATILDSPDADAPRLVAADWLEERGDPHAELIRIQCELSRRLGSDRRVESLRNSERELIGRHETSWIGPIRRLGYSGRWRRGFLEVSITGVRAFLESAERLFSNGRVLHAHLRDAAASSDDVSDLARSPHFARVQRLDLSRSQIGNDGVRQLASSRFIGRPTHVALSRVGLTTVGLSLLLANLPLERLVHLQLQGNEIGAGGGRELSLTPRCGRLRVLDFSFNRLGTMGGEYLARALYLSQLRSLSVVGNSIGTRGAKALYRRFGKRVRLVGCDRFF